MNSKPGIFLEPYRMLRQCRILLETILAVHPHFRFFKKTRNDEYPITLPIWFRQKVWGNSLNSPAYWPMDRSSMVSYSQNVLIGKGVFPGYLPGCYIHAVNKVFIGDYTFIAPNVGIMSGNHDLNDLRQQTKGEPIRIGSYCWLGMNSVILPEVVLGDFTIVGAGAIVTRSFEEGYCVIGGSPAKVIRTLDKESCIRFENKTEYLGYVRMDRFTEFRSKNLNV